MAFYFLVVLILHLVSISWDAISNDPDPKLPGLERACFFHLHHLSQIVLFAATCNAGPGCYSEDLGPARHGISRCYISLPLHSQGLAAAVLLSLKSMSFLPQPAINCCGGWCARKRIFQGSFCQCKRFGLLSVELARTCLQLNVEFRVTGQHCKANLPEGVGHSSLNATLSRHRVCQPHHFC